MTATHRSFTRSDCAQRERVSVGDWVLISEARKTRVLVGRVCEMLQAVLADTGRSVVRLWCSHAVPVARTENGVMFASKGRPDSNMLVRVECRHVQRVLRFAHTEYDEFK